MSIKIILAVVFSVLSIIGFLIGISNWEENKAKFWGFSIGAIISLILFILLPWSYFSISTGEIGVIKNFGNATEVVGAGLHNRFWMTYSVDRYDIKTREIELEFQAYSRDAQTMTGQLSVQYRIDPGQGLEISKQYGAVEALEQKLKAVILERAKSVFTAKSAMEIIETRGALSGEIEQKIVPDIVQYHVYVSMVSLSDIEFNEAFENAVEQKMIAEQEKLRSEYDKERAIIKAEEELEVAERQSKAVVQLAHGDAEALTIMQEAWGELSVEVRSAMLRQMFYEKWNGILPNVMSGESIDIIMDYKNQE